MKLTVEGEPEELLSWFGQLNRKYIESAREAADQAAAYAAKADAAARNAETALKKIEEMKK